MKAFVKNPYGDNDEIEIACTGQLCKIGNLFVAKAEVESALRAMGYKDIELEESE